MRHSWMLVAAVVFSSPLLAQKDSAKTLDPLIVTANKFEQKQSSTGKVITVITKEQIEKSAGKTVAQVLNEQAGVVVVGALNNLGSPQTLYVRGAASGRSLILIDGIPANDPSMINNECDLNLLTLDNVEQIEICKGAQSTLYGSDAIGGVINIITVNKDIKKPFNTKATIAAGNFGTVKGNVQLYGKADKLTYTARYGKLYTNGFSAAKDTVGNKGFDKDNYNGDIFSANVKYQLTSQLSIKAFGQYSRYKTEVDNGIFADATDFISTNKNFITGTGFQFKNDIVTLVGNYQYSDITRNLFNDSLDNPGTLSRDNYYGKSQFAEIYATIPLGAGFSLLQGGDFRHHTINQVNFGTYKYMGTLYTYGGTPFDSVASQSSLYASLLYSGLRNKLNIELGGRLNVHSRYGSNYTYTFNPSYKIDDHFRVFGSIATGFKAPSLYQLYAGGGVGPGNRDLQPEISTNYELGIQQSYGVFSHRLVGFHRIIKSGIDYDYNYPSFYFNFGKQKVDGIEWEATVRPVKNLTISTNYTWMDATEKTQSRKTFNDTTYSYALKRPKHNLNVNVGYSFTPAFYVSVNGKYVSSRYDVGGYQANDVNLNDYFILGGYAEYKYKQAKLFVNLQNITDRGFFDIRGYNSIPFMIQGGVTLNL